MGVCTCTSIKKSGQDQIRILSRDSEHALLDRFGSGQIQMLRSKFKQYEHNGGIDITSFKKIMPYISKLPIPIIDNAYSIFKGSSKDRISWTNFCATVAQYILGSRLEKCRFLYDVFDKKQRGMLAREEILLLNKHLIEVIKTRVASKVNKSNLLEACTNKANVIVFDEFSKWAIETIDLHKALQPFEIIPSAVTEKEIYLKLQSEMSTKGLIQGEDYYLVSKKWMEAWKNYVRFHSSEEELMESENENRYRATSFKSGARPIEISNNAIVDPNCSIRLLPNLRENIDFEILSKEAWADFYKWYGGGPMIMREAVTVGETVSVEIYPPVLKIFYKKAILGSVVKEPLLMLAKTKMIVSDLVESVKEKIEVEGDFGLSLKIGTEFVALQNDKILGDYQLQDINICSLDLLSENVNHSIISEETLQFNLEDAVEYLENGYWMSGIIQNITPTEYIIGASWHKKIIKINKTDISILRKPPIVPLSSKGIPFSTGITNIGNTCYMNSILQCIFHSPLINQYFTGLAYSDIKRKNNQNARLKVVEEVENLINDLRTSKELRIRPDRFYIEFTKVHKQYQGFEQHDSHEFLGTLLNSLHEDLKFSTTGFLNTINLKTNSIEEERKVSQDQWDKYRGMCGSVISAICGGQSRNVLQCNNCTEKSTIFEVFTDFSIPIPIKEYDASVIVVVVRILSKDYQKVLINVNKDDEIESFLDELQQKSKLPINKIVFAYVNGSRFTDYFQPESVSEVMNVDSGQLYAFEIISTIEEAEIHGQPTLKRPKSHNWRYELAVQSLVDIQVNNEWSVGIIKNIDTSNNITVQVQDSNAEITLIVPTCSNMQHFRSHTTSKNEILSLPLFHLKKYRNNLKYFGTPLVISIGCWCTQKQLIKLLYRSCKLFVNKKAKIKQKINFLIRQKSGKCAVCLKRKCFTCFISNGLGNLENWCESSKDLNLIALWEDEFMYKDNYLDDPDSTEECSIHECFTKYTEKEEIDSKCENCGHDKQQSQVEIWRLPDILIIHLKRFSYKNSRSVKINHLVKFPLVNLDMSFWMLNSKKTQGVTLKTTRDNCLYDLYAVVNHTGGISGGHYTTFCRLEDGKWLYFDDDRVYQVAGDPESEIVTKKAYILFYKRQRFTSGNVVKTISL